LELAAYGSWSEETCKFWEMRAGIVPPVVTATLLERRLRGFRQSLALLATNHATDRVLLALRIVLGTEAREHGLPLLE
jgi:hypothetical protein